MFIKYSPQRSDDVVSYKFDGESIIADYNGKTDTFDFYNVQDGFVNGIETNLTINPIINAERIDGYLYVELLKFIGYKADDGEKHTEWIEV